MSLLDQNLFTLSLVPSNDDPNILDLVDTAGTAHYRKERIPGPAYRIHLLDPTSEALLASATAPSATSKHKTIELHNPSSAVELRYTGTLTFRWSFKWEEHEFEWKREECYMIRKPDPPVLVAITKEPAGRIKTSTVQILDYNLNRFDIEDRKGLEIVILASLLTFSDSSDAYHSPVTPTDTPPSYTTASSSPVSPRSSRKGSSTGAIPTLPPKPAKKTGIERIAEMQALRGEINEVTVEDEGSVEDYAQYCCNLLQDESMLIVTVRSSSANDIMKVLEVVEETKRLQRVAGVAEALHQYNIYDSKVSRLSVIWPFKSSDDSSGKGKGKDKEGQRSSSKDLPEGAAPTMKDKTGLTVHLSKIPMPELETKPSGGGGTGEKGGTEVVKGRDKVKDKKGKGKYDDKSKKDDKKDSQRLSKVKSSPHLHVHSNEVHPWQPSPSPSQLGNPLLYTAPPPPPTLRPPRAGGARPTSFYGRMFG